MRSPFVSLLFSICAAAAWAQPSIIPQRPARVATPELMRAPRPCATGPELDRDLEKLHRFVQQKQGGRLRTLSAPSVRVDKGVYVMDADSAVAPFDRPFDLEGTSIYFTRTSSTSFTVQKTALNYDLSVGTLKATMSGMQTVSHALTSFAFPFYSSSVSTLSLTSTKGIYLTTPPPMYVYQLGGLEALNRRVPLIAPLLVPSNPPPYDSPDGSYYLYVKESSTSVTITWRYRYVGGDDVQVVLFSNGDIRFSYRTLGYALPYGTAVVTSGTESFYGSTTTLGSLSDTSGDASASLPAAVKDMLDVESAVIRRVSNSDLIEFVITTKGTITPGSIPAGSYLLFEVLPGNNAAEKQANELWIELGPSDTWYQPGGWYYTQNSPALLINGRTITARVLDEDLSFASLPITVDVQTWLETSTFTFGDVATASGIAMAAAATTTQTDLSQLMSATAIANKPIVEAFTLPRIDLFQVWSALQTSYGLSDTTVDQVAVYQTFNTDLDFYAGAYSTNSNPQVDNIMAPSVRSSYGTSYAKRASLLHLDKLGYGWNDTADGRLSVLSHEFGHRWLYGFTIRESAADTFHLNPDRAHPKQGVHLPAAFPYLTSTDSSTMGGGYFTQTGTLMYKTAATIGYYGYSWHELYLMGLADSAEMTSSWFYLNGSGLESAYYPSPNTTYTVTSRVDVSPSQLTTSMGLRNPSYSTSQKSFTMAFVILERSTAPLSSAEVATFASDYPKSFRPYFSTITGSRGSIKTAPDSMAPEANFSYSPSAPTPGSPVAFTDLSYGEPTSWNWSFGDGGTSTVQNPSHTFASNGVYLVKLTVTKASGSNAVTKSITVGVPPSGPTNVVATATTPRTITVTWDATPGSTYEVVRIEAGSFLSVRGTSTNGSFFDSGAGGTSYLYKVHKSAPASSDYGAPDLVTTLIFSDPTLTTGMTIRAAHMMELRTAITAVRTLAGKSAPVLTDPTLGVGTTIRSAHVTELRAALDEARTALGLPLVSYANSGAAHTLIRAADINELRSGVK